MKKIPHFFRSCKLVAGLPDARGKKFLRFGPSQAAFSLIELLTVLAVIAILSAILLAAISKSRKRADMAQAINNLRSLQLANQMYANENLDKFVPIFEFDEGGKSVSYWGWYANPELMKHIDSVVISNGIVVNTSRVVDPVAAASKAAQSNQLVASFGYNMEGTGGGWGQPGASPSLRRNQLKSAAQTMNFITSTDAIARHASRFNWLDNPVEGKTTDSRIAFRHDGKALAVFYDGHVEALTPEDIRRFDEIPDRWGRSGASHVFWNGSLD